MKQALAVLFWTVTLVICSIRPVSAKTNLITRVEIKGLHYLNEQVILQSLDMYSTQGAIHRKDKQKEDLESLFLTGYFSKVNVEEVADDRGISVIFHVTERPLIQHIFFKGNTVYSDAHLKRNIRSRIGDVFNVKKIEQDIDDLRTYYHNNGYELFDVQLVDINPSGNLTIHVIEGKIHHVNIEGLKQTKPFVVFRELQQKQGKVFNSDMLRKDRTKLLKLGYFSDVSIPKLSSYSDKEEIYINYSVNEKKVNLFDMGLEQLIDDTSLAGFFRVYYNHLLIYSDVISFKTQLLLDGSLTIRSYAFRYYQPWLFNIVPLSAAFDLWTEFRMDSFPNDSTVYSTERRGVAMLLGIPIIYSQLSLSTKAKLETVSPKDDTFTEYSIRSLSTILSFDTRNNVVNPGTGQLAVLSFEKGGDLGFIDVGGLDFVRWSLDFSSFFQMNEKSILALHANHGVFERGSDNMINSFESEEFPLGGVSSLRGYKELDFWGARRVLFNVEYRYSLVNDIQGVLFYDIGEVFDNEVSINLANYKTGRGFGFRFITGLALFRLDFGWGRDFIIHFGIGQTF